MGHTQLRLAGILMAKREMTTKTGNRMCFGTFSDASGVFEVTFFAETLATARQLLEVGAALAMAVEIQSRGEELRLTAMSVEPIDQALARSAARFVIYVDGVHAIQPLQRAARPRRAGALQGQPAAAAGADRGGRDRAARRLCRGRPGQGGAEIGARRAQRRGCSEAGKDFARRLGSAEANPTSHSLEPVLGSPMRTQPTHPQTSARSFLRTSSTSSAEARPLNTAPRARQSSDFTWSASTALGTPPAIRTSNG